MFIYFPVGFVFTNDGRDIFILEVMLTFQMCLLFSGTLIHCEKMANKSESIVLPTTACI